MFENYVKNSMLNIVLVDVIRTVLLFIIIFCRKMFKNSKFFSKSNI